MQSHDTTVVSTRLVLDQMCAVGTTVLLDGSSQTGMKHDFWCPTPDQGFLGLLSCHACTLVHTINQTLRMMRWKVPSLSGKWPHERLFHFMSDSPLCWCGMCLHQNHLNETLRRSLLQNKPDVLLWHNRHQVDYFTAKYEGTQRTIYELKGYIAAKIIYARGSPPALVRFSK